MSRRSPPAALLLLGIAGCMLLTACDAKRGLDSHDSPPASGPVVLDAAGVEHVLDGPARRIVSLVPSATTTLRAIGADAALVGRTDFDTEEWVQDRPSVGGGLDPNLEAIVALRPDLVIRFAGEQDPRIGARLDALGIRHLAVRPDHVEDIYRTATLLGQVTGYAAAADSLIARIRDELSAMASASRDLPRLRVAYVLGGSPPWVAGPDTYIGEVISIIGGDNVFQDLDVLYSSVSPEEFRIREIDVVLVSAGSDFDESLAPGSRVEVVGSALEIPGPGIVDAARQIDSIMHGRSMR